MAGWPFRQPLMSLGLGDDVRPDDKLSRLAGDSCSVIRQSRLADTVVPGSDITVEQAVKDLVIARAELLALRHEFGVAVPAFQFFISHNGAGEPAQFVRVDWVSGVDLLAILDEPSSAPGLDSNQINTWLEGLLRYMISRYESRGWFLNDVVDEGQYRYGRTARDEEPQLYLLDLDPLFEHVEDWPVFVDAVQRVIMLVSQMFRYYDVSLAGPVSLCTDLVEAVLAEASVTAELQDGLDAWMKRHLG